MLAPTLLLPVMTCLIAATTLWEPGRTGRWSAVCLTFFILTIGLLVARRPGITMAITMACGVWAAALIPFRVDGQPASISFVAGSSLIMVMAYAFRPKVAVAVSLVILVIAFLLTGSGEQSLLVRVDGLVLNVGIIVAGAAFLTSLETHADRADELAAESFAAEVTYQTEQARLAAENRVRWTLHDDIIGTLNAVALLPDSEQEEVRRAARRAVHLTRSSGLAPTGPDVATDLVDTIVADSALQITVVDEGMDEVGSLPEEVRAALSAAAREALRNVSRHAGTHKATLRVTGLGPGVEVVIEDQGRGLGANFRPGFGISSSITDRVETIGGHAEVSNRAGGGTRVRLVWQPEQGSPQRGAPFADDLINQVGVKVMAALWVAHSVLSLAHALLSQSVHRLATTMLALLVIVGVGSVVLRVRRATPSLREVILVTAASTTSMTLGLYLTGASHSGEPYVWPMAFPQLALTALAYYTPASRLPLLTIPPFLTVGLTVWLDPLAPPGQALALALAASLPALLGTWGVRTIRATTDQLAKANAELVATEVHLREARAGEEASERHLHNSLRVTVPWLEQIADGSIAIDDDARRMARIFAAASRDDLNAPGVLSDRVRFAILGFRQRGGVLTLRGPLAPLHGGSLQDALPSLLPALAVEQRVVVTALEDRAIEVSIAPPLSQHQKHSLSLNPETSETAALFSILTIRPTAGQGPPKHPLQGTEHV